MTRLFASMSSDPHREHQPSPFTLVPRFLNLAAVAWVRELSTTAYGHMEVIRKANVPFAAEIEMLPRGRFVVTASSFSLDAVLDDQDVVRLLDVIGSGPVRNVADILGDHPVMDLDRSWLRRQFPPRHAPRFHAPHGWHQDGALGYDFTVFDPGAAKEGLLEMITCWIALTPCGQDAPGLELIDEYMEELQPFDSLKDPDLRSRFPNASFKQPRMEAGDALLFPGGTLHQTHVTADMHLERTSLELRFFPLGRLPQRLQGDHFIPLDPGT